MSAMIALYCRAHHQAAGALCAECSGLRDYALARLDRCPFGDKKPTCAKCPIHCYKADMKARIKEVMRYSGRRLVLRGRLHYLLHLLA